MRSSIKQKKQKQAISNNTKINSSGKLLTAKQARAIYESSLRRAKAKWPKYLDELCESIREAANNGNTSLMIKLPGPGAYNNELAAYIMSRLKFKGFRVTVSGKSTNEFDYGKPYTLLIHW